ncbi:MAG: SUMF1/EgtB/PvdO family nonheme iron enzyme [Pirellulales bacterium]
MSIRQTRTVRSPFRAAGMLALLLGTLGTVVGQDASTPATPRTPPPARPAVPSRNIALDRGVLFEPVEGSAPQGNAGLFIGVNDFTKDKQLNRLQFAVNDAAEQAHLFVFELKLIPAQNCRLLLSGESSSPVVRRHLEQLVAAGATVTSADKPEILTQLEAVRAMGRESTDLLVCSVSSHGFIDGRMPYVMPSDGLKSRLQLTAVPLDTIEGDMEQSRAGHRLLFVDACQERIAARNLGGQPQGQGMDAAFREAFAKATGQYKLASCSAKELSYENPGLGDVGHGVFTHALLEALRGGAAADGENLVRLSAVEEYVSTYVTKWSADAKLPAQTPFSAGARGSRALPLAKKADDLATLVASVRKQPLSGGFSAELRGSLVATLGQLDLEKEADRELATATREFLSGKTRVALFVPYLRTELARRQAPPSPQLVRASFTVREGDDDSASLLAGALVELQWQASGSSKLETLGMATTDDQGRVRIELRVGSLPTKSGQYYARVSKGARSRDWTLENFPTTSSWRLYLPRPMLPLQPGSILENSIGMKLAYIPPGEFQMGSPATEAGRREEEFLHRVRITRGFHLGVYEVTQGEYEQVMGTNPSWFSRSGDGKTSVSGQDTSRFPVEDVSWEDAVDFCRKLSALPAERAAARSYRLPTEAEWEYACRAGTMTPFFWGGVLNGDRANCDGSNPYGTAVKGAYLERTTRVGSYAANAWGLHDMHGNVLEWCSDWSGYEYYRTSPAADPAGPSTGSFRCIRGGCFGFTAGDVRCANRGGLVPSYRSLSLGFRVAAVPSSAK